MSRNYLLAFFLGVSLFGLAVAMVFALYPPQALEDFPLRKTLVGSIFELICVAGIVAVFFPGPCSRAVSLRSEGRKSLIHESRKPEGKKLDFRGHHPDCGNFTAHVFQVGDKTLCAGCTGLFLGGLAAFIGGLLYFFLGLQFVQVSFMLSWIGAAGVVLGLIQPSLFSPPRSSVRMFVNAFFSFGAFLILAGVDGIAQSISVDIFLIVLIAFWLLTKISLSHWGHDEICRRCKVSACELRGF